MVSVRSGCLQSCSGVCSGGSSRPREIRRKRFEESDGRLKAKFPKAEIAGRMEKEDVYDIEFKQAREVRKQTSSKTARFRTGKRDRGEGSPKAVKETVDRSTRRAPSRVMEMMDVKEGKDVLHGTKSSS